MKDEIVLIGKRVYKDKKQAMKALKEFDRRVQRRIEKQKAKQLIEYDYDYE